MGRQRPYVPYGFRSGLDRHEADNDVGAVSTYVQAGAQYGTHLLWLLLLLLPISYFVQEMVVRLGVAYSGCSSFGCCSWRA